MPQVREVPDALTGMSKRMTSTDGEQICQFVRWN